MVMKNKSLPDFVAQSKIVIGSQFMKILTVVYSLAKGGTQRAAVNFAVAYDELGHDSRLLFTMESGCRAEYLSCSGIMIYDVSKEHDMEALRAWKPDVIHIHSHSLPFDCVSQLKHKLRPCEIWETNVFSWPSQWEDLIDKTFQLSEWCQYLYIKRGGNRLKSHVVPYPVNIRPFSRDSSALIEDFRASLGFNNDSIILGRVGQAYDGKWSSHLISIFEEVSRTRQNAFLLLVDPPARIRERAAASPFSESIRIIGPIEDDSMLKTIYSSIDIFAHIAEQGESFGMVLAESLLCKTPVVTLATPWGDNSQAEVIGKGIGGFVAGTPNGFLRMTKLLFDNQHLRAELGARGRDYILNNFSSRRVAEIALATGNLPSLGNSFSDACNLYFVNKQPMIQARLALRAHKPSLLQYATGYKPWAVWVKQNTTGSKLFAIWVKQKLASIKRKVYAIFSI